MEECEMYCPNTNSWSKITSLPVPMNNFAGLVDEATNSIFLSGGFTKVRGGSNFNTFYCYKPEEKIVLELPKLLNNRGSHIMIKLLNGDIALVGGQDHPFTGRSVWTIETYNIHRKQWMVFDKSKPRGPLAREFRLNHQQVDNTIIIWAIDFINSGQEILEYNFSMKKWRSTTQTKSEFEVLDIARRLM